MANGLQLYSLSPSQNRVLEHLAQGLDELDFPRRRPHELLVLSCYLRTPALETLISVVSARVRLRRVRVLFDEGELYAQGPAKLAEAFRKLERRLEREGVEIEWSPVRPRNGAMVHAKAYGVLQFDGSGEMAGGLVISGSANATDRGLGQCSLPNVEIGHLSSRRSDVVAFVREFGGLWETSRVGVGQAIAKDQEELFNFAVLADGRFLAKWSGNIRSLFAYKFQLNEKGMREAVVPSAELQAMNMVVGQATLTRVYLDIPVEVERRSFPASFGRELTIETSIGRFCPGPIWRATRRILDERDADASAALVRCLSESALDKAVRLAREHADRLSRLGWIDFDGQAIRAWADRMRDLRANPERIERIRRTYSDFALPYDRQAVSEIAEVIESIRESFELRKKLNFAGRKLQAALARRSLDSLELSDGEHLLLERMLLDQDAD